MWEKSKLFKNLNIKEKSLSCKQGIKLIHCVKLGKIVKTTDMTIANEDLRDCTFTVGDFDHLTSLIASRDIYFGKFGPLFLQHPLGGNAIGTKRSGIDDYLRHYGSRIKYADVYSRSLHALQ
jgi:hypothetical protein